MLTSLTLVIISLYLCTSSHHVVHFKYITFSFKEERLSLKATVDNIYQKFKCAYCLTQQFH